MAFVGQKAVKGLAAGIGLISESISAHKAKKEGSQSHTREDNTQQDPSSAVDNRRDSEPPNETRTAIDSLEEQWELDETQDELRCQEADPNHAQPDSSEEAIDAAIHRFTSEYPPPPYPSDGVPKLPAPILLPQRRPKQRKRGFIRAYAPDLAAFSIDQHMFLEFLDTAEKSCQGAKWLNCINLASIGTMFMPSVTGLAVSIAIQIATDVAIAVDGTRRTNNFFDKMNKELFQPRGLFCLVMTWNSELADQPSTTLDMTSMVFKSSDAGSDMLSRLRHKFKSSDGKTYGNIFPEVAPLIFPGLDELASDQDAAKKISKTKKKMEFVNGYFDKRAQAQFAAKNPESHLAQGPKPTFSSRYADPEHPASSGDLLALVSGGHISRGKLLGMGSGRLPLGRRGSPADPYASQAYEGNGSRTNSPAPHAAHGRPLGMGGMVSGIRGARGSRFGPSASSGGSDSVAGNSQTLLTGRNIGLISPIAKLREQKVLYLAIVNMPPEAEMAAAREAIGQS